MLGQQASGKTSLVERYMKRTFRNDYHSVSLFTQKPHLLLQHANKFTVNRTGVGRLLDKVDCVRRKWFYACSSFSVYKVQLVTVLG